MLRSCPRCLAWGMLHGGAGGICAACHQFAREHGAGQCAGCGCLQPVRKQYCRLCWNQARTLGKESGEIRHKAGPMLHLDRVRQHQLFFANMVSTRGGTTTPPRRFDRRGGRTKPAPAPVGRPRDRGTQLMLLEDLRRDYRRFVEGSDTAPDNPWLVWGLYLAHRRAEVYGWSRWVRIGVNRALTIVLSCHVEGEMVSYSAMFSGLQGLAISCDRVAGVLTEMGILIDDRRSPFDVIVDAKLTGITPGIAGPVETWLRALHGGGPRLRVRSLDTVRLHAHGLRPLLLDWSATYDHLREVTRDDVLTALNAVTGVNRQRTLVSLRSLFGFSRKSGVVFRNPTSGIPVGEGYNKLIQPLPDREVQRTIASAARPADRLIIALAAVHAARSGGIRAIRLDDVDLGNRRLTIAGRTRPLDELTRHLLLEWMDYRRTRWPNTANPHLLINQMTAMGLTAVNKHWIDVGCRGQEATVERMRVDRQLEEALTHGPDPLHLAVVFGLDDKTAIRYAANARHLLESAIEHTPPPTDRDR